VLGLLVLLIGAFFMAGRAALRQVTEDVPTHDYGMCTGLTQPGAKGPALTTGCARRLMMPRALSRVRGR
jgi:hypothetical protein